MKSNVGSVGTHEQRSQDRNIWNSDNNLGKHITNIFSSPHGNLITLCEKPVREAKSGDCFF